MAPRKRGKSGRMRALAFAADLYGDKADAWIDGEVCRLGYRTGVGGILFRTIGGEGPTWEAALEDVRAKLRRDALTYRMDWYDTLVTCAIDGTLDRENAAQFMAWCEQRAIEAQRACI